MTRFNLRRRVPNVSLTTAIFALAGSCMVIGAFVLAVGTIALTADLAGRHVAIAVFGAFLVGYGFVGYRIAAELDGQSTR